MRKDIKEYPVILTAVEVAEILKVSKPTAYQVMDQPGFPLIKLNNRCKRVLRDSFFSWLGK
jgi:predicted DNA-binding transcriptional regulator AlpA